MAFCFLQSTLAPELKTSRSSTSHQLPSPAYNIQVWIVLMHTQSSNTLQCTIPRCPSNKCAGSEPASKPLQPHHNVMGCCGLGGYLAQKQSSSYSPSGTSNLVVLQLTYMHAVHERVQCMCTVTCSLSSQPQKPCTPADPPANQRPSLPDQRGPAYRKVQIS